jgi:signal transduction histidine kinase
VLRLLGSLRGLRVQLLLWLVVPLTGALIIAALISTSIHQGLMRQLVEELDARSAWLAATRLSDRLAERVTLLQIIAANEALTLSEVADPLFDGGLARLDASSKLEEAFPSAEVWQTRPVSELLAIKNASLEVKPGSTIFSPLFVDPFLGQDSIMIGLVSSDHKLVTGVVSLEQLGLTEIVSQAKTTNVPGLAEPHTGTVLGNNRNLTSSSAVAFLVDAEGQVIYHPDPALVGQNLKAHEGVASVIRGQAGATYHREPDGQELAVGYAPVAGPGWGLVVQEPWEALIAPTARLSLLVPLTLIIAVLVAGLAVTFGLRYVIHPLQTLDRQATRLAWGDFTAVSTPVGGVQEIEDLRRTLAGMADQIQRYQSGLRDYVGAVTMAQEEERRRLARELHDETIQSLIALGHRVEMVQKALDKDPERARQRLAELSQLANETQQEVRRFSRALRPLYLEDLGLIPALEMLAQEVEQQSDLTVSVRVEGPVRRLAPDLELTAYRMAQEGLSNVVRHAQAQNVWLTINFATDELTIRLQDNGQGFEPPVNPAELAQAGHFGLMGLHERALLFGGQLKVHSSRSEGTTLEILLPLTDV